MTIPFSIIHMSTLITRTRTAILPPQLLSVRVKLIRTVLPTQRPNGQVAWVWAIMTGGAMAMLSFDRACWY